MKKALMLIDLQIDFCPGGTLQVAEGNQVIPIANEMMEKFDHIIATQDWHPADHGSFAANHYWRKPYQVIDLHGLEQVLWPIHCVQNSFGASFAPKLNTSKFDKIFQKGTDKEVDSYSGFYDNGRRKSTGLAEYLKEQGINELYIMGLATDYCVKYTVLDALKEGFKTHVIKEGCRGVNRTETDSENAFLEMKEKGAILIEDRNLIKKMDVKTA